MGVVKPLLELVLVVAERGGGELRGAVGVPETRVGGDEANLVDSNAFRAGQSRLQLLGEFGRLRFAGRKRAREKSKFFFRDSGEKLDAGEACGGKKLRELLFGGRAFERHAVEQELVAGRAQKQAGVGAGRNCSAQFTKGNAEKFVGATCSKP